MNCLLCKGKTFSVQQHNNADKYQGLIQSNDAWHTWYYCKACDFYVSENSETPEERREIYMKYWQKEMRGATVEEFFPEAQNIQLKLNMERIGWITQQSPLTSDTKILDIGSGYATFPHTFKRLGQNIECLEPEPTMARYIKDTLKMPCYECFYEDYKPDGKYTLIIMSNVLEHFENPIEMLKKAKGQLTEGGSIYIEVPEASEFDLLPEDHDDFNSLHLWFFSEKSLRTMLAMSGLAIKKMEVGTFKGFQRSIIKRLKVMCEASDFINENIPKDYKKRFDEYVG